GDGHHAGDAFGPAEQEPGQRVRVQLVAEVRVVGHGEQVQAVPVGLGAEPDAPGRVSGIRAVPLAKRGTEQDIVSWHQPSFRRSPLDTSSPPDIMPQAFPRKRLVNAFTRRLTVDLINLVDYLMLRGVVLQMFNQVDHLGDGMPVLTAPATPTHDLGGARFTSLATPSRGATDTSVWKVEILPGAPATPHSLTREANAGAGPLRLLCCLPVGGQARLPDGSTFTPPWAE